MRDPRFLVLYAAEDPEYTRWVFQLVRQLGDAGSRVELRDVESWLSEPGEASEFDRVLVIGSPRLRRLWERIGLPEQLAGIDRDRIVPVLGRGAWTDALPDPFVWTEPIDLTARGRMGARSEILLRRLFEPEGRRTGGTIRGGGDFDFDLPAARSPGTGGGGAEYGGGEAAEEPPPADPDKEQPADPPPLPDSGTSQPADPPPPLDPGPTFAPAPEPAPAPVQVTTVSPATVEPGARFRVEVVFHVEGYEVEAGEDRTVDENVATLALREGARLTVRLVSVDEGAFSIDDPEAPVVWGPPSRKVDFRLRAAKELADDVYDLRVETWCGEVQLARSYLEIAVGREPEAREKPTVTRRALPRSAFASYARVDKVAVAGRVDSLKAFGIDVFLDSLDIRQGADWRQVLERELLGRDRLLLFWSTAAKASEWVEKEWRYALDHRGLEGIVPNALEPTDDCPPPPELKGLQFGSVLTELVKSWRRDAADRSGRSPGDPL